MTLVERVLISRENHVGDIIQAVRARLERENYSRPVRVTDVRRLSNLEVRRLHLPQEVGWWFEVVIDVPESAPAATSIFPQS